MKKILAMLLALGMVASFAACGDDANDGEDTSADTTVAEDTTVEDTTVADDEADASVMSYADYVAAELDSEVTIDAYVQATQAWWENEGQGVITVYAQDEDGAYFLYEMKCSEEDSAKLVPGTAIKVTGYKAEWSGEVEIVDATFEFAGDDTYIAEAIDLTDKLGTDELINYQNQLALFKGLTLESISYKDSEWDPDIYVTFSAGDNTYDFCVENYLTGPDTDLYKTVAALEIGTVVDVEGFVYWYEGVNTHITGIATVE